MIRAFIDRISLVRQCEEYEKYGACPCDRDNFGDRDRVTLEITPERLLVEVEDVLRTLPPRATLRHDTEQNFSWFGRAAAVLQHWTPSLSERVTNYAINIRSNDARKAGTAIDLLITLLHQARHDLQMRTSGPLSVMIPRAAPYEYFEEIRKYIELATSDLFFVDPYLSAEFVRRYLGSATQGVTIRLLARDKLADLLPAVDAFVNQYGSTIQVRSAGKEFHDRFMFVDQTSCYQSGASFKDGGTSSPTILTQIIDAFPAIWKTYDDLWGAAKVER